MTAVAMVLLCVGGACCFSRIVAGPSLADRLAALDALVVTIVAAILLDAIASRSARFLDAALVFAFVGFVGTAAGARFVERRGG